MLWFRFRGPQGKLWHVFYGSPCDYPKLNMGCVPIAASHMYSEFDRIAALTDFNVRHIYVNSDAMDDSPSECVLHEMMHVAASASVRPFSASTEEKFIRHTSPPLHSMLANFGFKLPRKPRRRSG